MYASQFRVVAGHETIWWLANLKGASTRLARWSLRLQEFGMFVVYKSCQKHRDADCLSRSPVESASVGIDDEDEESFLEVDNMGVIVNFSQTTLIFAHRLNI